MDIDDFKISSPAYRPNLESRRLRDQMVAKGKCEICHSSWKNGNYLCFFCQQEFWPVRKAVVTPKDQWKDDEHIISYFDTINRNLARGLERCGVCKYWWCEGSEMACKYCSFYDSYLRKKTGIVPEPGYYLVYATSCRDYYSLD